MGVCMCPSKLKCIELCCVTIFLKSPWFTSSLMNVVVYLCIFLTEPYFILTLVNNIIFACICWHVFAKTTDLFCLCGCVNHHFILQTLVPGNFLLLIMFIDIFVNIFWANNKIFTMTRCFNSAVNDHIICMIQHWNQM